MKRIILIGIALTFIVLVAIAIKFVIKVTPGHAVIKEYSYSGNVKELISHVQNFSKADSDVVSKLTDTTGYDKVGYTFYMDIELKNGGHHFLYTIACKNDDKVKSVTSIKLVMAYDKINNVGGYRKEAKGIKPLVNNFDINFITPLKNTQNIKITPL